MTRRTLKAHMPFKNPQNLTINYPEKEDISVIRDCYNYVYRDSLPRLPTGDEPPKQPNYETEQHSDRFKLKVSILGFYNPIIDWQAIDILAEIQPLQEEF